jgi:nitrogenase molybdenum-iron protein beta chain
MYAGGTTIDEVKDAPNALTTILMQPLGLDKTKKFVENTWNQEVPKLNIPMGVQWTDEWLMKISEITGKAIPESLTKERGRLMDMMTDSHAWLHGKKMAVYGDPDFTLGMVKFLMELGVEPTHIVCNNGSKRWDKTMKKVLESSPYGASARTYPGADLWHLRSLCFTDKPDYIIGNSYGKFIQRDTLHKGKEFEVPLIRIGFPIFDRHHLHRMTTLGYEGAMYILTTLTNAVLERLDEETKYLAVTDYNFDLVR